MARSHVAFFYLFFAGFVLGTPMSFSADDPNSFFFEPNSEVIGHAGELVQVGNRIELRSDRKFDRVFLDSTAVYIVEAVNAQLVQIALKSLREVKGQIHRSHLMTLRQAEEKYTAIITSKESNATERAWAHFHRGTVWAGLVDTKKSSEDFQKAAELDPTLRVEASIKQALALKSVDQFSPAVATLEPLLNAQTFLTPEERFSIHLYLADAYLHLLNVPKSRTHAKAAILIRSAIPLLRARALCTAGHLEHVAGNISEAIRLYDEAIHEDPNQAHIWVLRSISERRNNNYARAHQDLLRALEIGPQNPTVLSRYAWFLSTPPDNEKQYLNKELALTNAEKAFSFFGAATDPFSYFALAAAQAANSHYDLAREAQERGNKLCRVESERVFGVSCLDIYKTDKRITYRE